MIFLAGVLIGMLIGAGILFIGIAIGREMGRNESGYYNFE